jgi:hypothetical protein
MKMKDLRKSKAWLISAGVVLATLITIPFSVAQQKSDEQLKKEYGPILGEYEFDMTAMGGGTFLLNYYIKDGNLWVDSGDGRPAIMQPVEGKTFVFKAEDPEAGAFNISFEKDEEGTYTKNRVFIDMQGIEVVGHKVK